MKNTLVQLPSGTVDLAHENGKMYIQFNASCLDALPYCHGICCKLQSYLSVSLNEKETKRFATRTWGKDESGPNNLIQIKPNTMECKYVENDICSVHNQKPERCRQWHCSPGGNLNDESITIRGNGWLMLPS